MCITNGLVMVVMAAKHALHPCVRQMHARQCAAGRQGSSLDSLSIAVCWCNSSMCTYSAQHAAREHQFSAKLSVQVDAGCTCLQQVMSCSPTV